MSAPYMPFYVGDYIRKTTHLTTEQHGAYLLLIFAMFSAGGSLPNDDKKLARICGLSKPKWATNKPDLLAFFHVNGDLLTHSKITEVSKKYNEKLLKLAQNGSKGGTAKALKSNETHLANGLAKSCQLEPEPNIDTNVSIKGAKKSENQSPKLGPFQDAINAQSQTGRSRLKRPQAWAAWQRLSKIHGEEKLLAAYKRYLSTDKDAQRDNGEWQAGLQVWLNQKADIWLEQHTKAKTAPTLQMIRNMVIGAIYAPTSGFDEYKAGMTFQEAKDLVAAAEADGRLVPRPKVTEDMDF